MPGEHPNRVKVRNYVKDCCDEFIQNGLADSKFLSELHSGEEQKFWACVSEALIAHYLEGKQFGNPDKIGIGPDFLIINNQQRIWVEVVCPEPIDIPTEWCDADWGKAISFPHNEILLRWTSAIISKIDKLMGSARTGKSGYLASGLVGVSDAYVIAVNACRLKNGPFPELYGISRTPFAAEAVLPIGPYVIQIDNKSLKMSEGGLQYRPSIPKPNGSVVPAETFLDPNFAPVSAIWALQFDGGSAIGYIEPSLMIHNPYAKNPVPIGFFPTNEEYSIRIEEDKFILQKHSTGTPDAG